MRDPFDFGPPPSGFQNGTGGSGPDPWGTESPGWGARDPWASDRAEGDTVTATAADQDALYGRPPLSLLLASLVLAVVAGVGALLWGAELSVAVVCWVVAGPLSIGLLALFAQRNTAARARPIYVPPAGLPVITWTAYVLVAAAILLSALRIADWAGHL